MKHTKGEWSLFYNEQGTYSIGANVDTENQEIIAEVFESDNGSDEANAKLIAAAPDMFNALQIAYDYLSQNCLEDYGHWKEVQLAIKKATE
jgi:hypothetical protein